jgi:hypothetical protein
MRAEELYWQQRAGEKEILEGDDNIAYFHLKANGRRRKKMILNLDLEGRAVTDANQIREIIYSYYKDLFGKQPRRTVKLGEEAWSDRGRLSTSDNEELLKPIMETELKKTIFGMKENTAPGPDGFGVSFYKNCWGTIKGELMNLMNDFYLNNLDIERLNYGVITLVPKMAYANSVKQFGPICLLKVSFKIFTKLLMDRLTNFATKLIDPSQTAFIKERYIVDGAVTLHEIVHELKRKKLKGVILKIDFEKAYDSIRWDFVEEVLEKKGFDNKLKEWIMSSVRGGGSVHQY